MNLPDVEVRPSIFERFTLRRLMQGKNMHGDSFAICARSDGRFQWSVCAHDCKWTEAGSDRTQAEAQAAVEAVLRNRNQAA